MHLVHDHSIRHHRHTGGRHRRRHDHPRRGQRLLRQRHEPRDVSLHHDESSVQRPADHHGHHPAAGSHTPGRDPQPGRRQHLVPDQLRRLPQRHGPDGSGLCLLQLLLSGERDRCNRLAHRADRLHAPARCSRSTTSTTPISRKASTPRTTVGTTAGAPDRTRSSDGAPALPGSGNGAKSLGQELESSQAFASCQVTRVFKDVCLRAPQQRRRRHAESTR